jgi:hypothetical protein
MANNGYSLNLSIGNLINFDNGDLSAKFAAAQKHDSGIARRRAKHYYEFGQGCSCRQHFPQLPRLLI